MKNKELTLAFAVPGLVKIFSFFEKENLIAQIKEFVLNSDPETLINHTQTLSKIYFSMKSSNLKEKIVQSVFSSGDNNFIATFYSFVKKDFSEIIEEKFPTLK